MGAGTKKGFQYRGGLEAIQEAMREELQGADFLTGSGIEVVTETEGDLLGKMDAVVSKRLGTLMVVMLLSGNKGSGGMAKMLREVRLAVRIFENPLFQATKGGHRKSGLWLAEWTAHVLDHLDLSATVASAKVLMLSEEDSIVPVNTEYGARGVNVYDVSFQTSLGLCPSLEPNPIEES